MPQYAGVVSVLSEAASMRSVVTVLSMCFTLHPVLSNRVSAKSTVTVLPVSVSFAVTVVSKAVSVWSAATILSVVSEMSMVTYLSKVFLVRSTCTSKHLSEVAPVKSEGLVWLTVRSWRSATVLSEASSVRLIMKVLSRAVSDKSVLTVLSGAVPIRSVETVTCLLTSVAVSTKSVVRVL